MKPPKTKIIDGQKYRKSASEYTRSRARDKASELRCEGYKVRIEPLDTGRFILYMCEEIDVI